MDKRIYKIQNKIKIKWKNSLIRKNMKLKLEIIRLRKLLEETKNQNHRLLDQKSLDNIRIRELTLEVRKWKIIRYMYMV